MAAATFVSASRCVAQSWLEVTPVAGTFLPTSHLINDANIGVTFKQRPSYAVGARIAARLIDRLAIEGIAEYSGSGVTVATSGRSADTTAYVVIGTARLRVGIGPQLSAMSWHLSAGVGFVAHHGPAFAGMSSTARAGGVLGAGARLHVPFIRILDVEFEESIYTLHFIDHNSSILTRRLLGNSRPWQLGQTAPQTQHDFVLTVGVPLGFGRL
jgi:hypothetical protein